MACTYMCTCTWTWTRAGSHSDNVPTLAQEEEGAPSPSMRASQANRAKETKAVLDKYAAKESKAVLAKFDSKQRRSSVEQFGAKSKQLTRAKTQKLEPTLARRSKDTVVLTFTWAWPRWSSRAGQ